MDGVLKAGTFLTRAGAVAATGATVFGVLAGEVDATAANERGRLLDGQLPQGLDRGGKLRGDH
jgi:hypothetical protein